jgi:ribosomal protein S18 acetylase RimI-like enzyme
VAAGVLTVRPATIDDAYAIARLHVQAWQRAYAGILPDETLATLDVDARATRWRENLGRREGAETRVALHGHHLRGFASFGPYRLAQDRANPDPRYGEVYAIYVDPEHFGAGTGRVLMDAAVAGLAGRGWAEIRLWVLEANLRARRFYERYGFAVDTAPDAYAGFTVDRPGADPVQLPEVRYRLAVGDAGNGTAPREG